MFTAEVVLFYLATHCMLAHNEARQNYMVEKYEEAVKLLPEMGEREQKVFKADCSLPNDTCKSILTKTVVRRAMHVNVRVFIICSLIWILMF